MKNRTVLIPCILIILIGIQIKSFSATFEDIKTPICFTPQSTTYTYDEDDVFKLVVPSNQHGKYFAFEMTVIEGDLNISSSLDFDPVSPDWSYHSPTDSYRNNWSQNAEFDLYFQVAPGDQHPVDYAKIRFRWKWHTDPDELEDMSTWEGTAYFYVNVNDPTISVPTTSCYSPSGTATCSNYPGFIQWVEWGRSSNLRFTSFAKGSSVSVAAASSSTSSQGWVQPRYQTAAGHLYCEKIYLWAGKPGQPTTNPTGYPTVEMALYEYKTVSVSSGPGATNYSWSATGSVTRTTGSTGSTMTMQATSTGNGNFYCYGTNICGTSATAGGGAVSVSSGGGPLGPEGGGLMSVQPVPADSYIEISFNKIQENPEISTMDLNSASSSKSFFRIINKYGEVKVTEAYQGEEIIQINTSSLSPGLYTLQLVTDQKIYNENLLISR